MGKIKISRDMRKKIAENREKISEGEQKETNQPKVSKKSILENIKREISNSEARVGQKTSSWNYDIGELVKFKVDDKNTGFGMVLSIQGDSAYLKSPAGNGWYRCAELRKVS